MSASAISTSLGDTVGVGVVISTTSIVAVCCMVVLGVGPRLGIPVVGLPVGGDVESTTSPVVSSAPETRAIIGEFDGDLVGTEVNTGTGTGKVSGGPAPAGGAPGTTPPLARSILASSPLLLPSNPPFPYDTPKATIASTKLPKINAEEATKMNLVRRLEKDIQLGSIPSFSASESSSES